MCMCPINSAVVRAFRLEARAKTGEVSPLTIGRCALAPSKARTSGRCAMLPLNDRREGLDEALSLVEAMILRAMWSFATPARWGWRGSSRVTRPIARLAQVQEPGSAGGAPRGGRGLEPIAAREG
jgi:hypothetical protein